MVLRIALSATDLDLFALGSGRHRRARRLRWNLRHGLNGSHLLRHWRRCGRLLLRQQRLHIVLDDAPIRACAADVRHVEAMLLRRCAAQSG